MDRVQATIVAGGNVRLSGVQLVPEAYAALVEICDRDGLNWAEVINVGITTLNEVAKMGEKQGRPLRLAR